MAIADLMNKAVLLHGIGSGAIKTVTNKMVTINHAQSLKLDVSTTLEDVFGGDSLFPIYTYVSKKEGSLELGLADLKIAQLGVGQAVNYKTSGNKEARRAIINKSTTSLGNDLTGVEVFGVIAPDGIPAECGTDTTDVVAGGLAIDATGTVAFDTAAAEGEYEVFYEVDAEDAITAVMLKDAMPEVCSVLWKFQTEDSDGNKYLMSIKIKRARCDGALTLNTERDKASTPTLKISILDPGDDTEEFMTLTLSRIKS